jgi:hypothetical protein
MAHYNKHQQRSTPPPRLPVQIDIEGIFSYFGLKAGEQSRRQSIRSLQVRMKQINCIISFKAAEQWFLRKRIPTEHLVNFARLAKYEQRPFDLTRFLKAGGSTNGR